METLSEALPSAPRSPSGEGALLSRARLREWRAPGIGAAVTTIGWFAATATTNPARWPGQVRLLAWIGLVLLSFWGWGTIACRLFRVEAIRGFVRVALGMAALLAVAGVFLAAHALPYGVLAALLLVGAGTQLAILIDDAPRRWARRVWWPNVAPGHAGYLVAATLVLLFAIVRLIGSAKSVFPWWDADDTPAYWAFIRELTQRGSFDQAFSFRRMVAFGGQTVLQALLGLGVPIRSINIFDNGICPLLMAGILLQVGFGNWLAAAAALLVVGTPTAALNSASAFSGSLFFLLTYLTLRATKDGHPRGGGVLTGVAAAGLATLRHSFIPGCAVLLAAAGVAHAIPARGRPIRERLAFVVPAAVTFAAALIPWSLASLIATHTPMFPLFHGTYRGGGVDLGVGGLTWIDGLKGIVEAAPPMPQIAVVFMAIVALGTRISRAALVPVALATLVSTIALAKAAPSNPGDDVRYLASPWIGLVAAFYCEAAAREQGARIRDRLLVAGVATVIVAFQLVPSIPAAFGVLTQNDRVRAHWVAWEGEDAARHQALDLQSHAPRGAAILAACDQEYHFNFRRNKIVLADLPTVASPVPLPGENATPAQYEETAARLQGLGIDYLIFSDPARSTTMYSEPRWRSFLGDGYRTHELLAPRFLAWFGFEKYLAAHRRVVATAGIEKLVSLR